MGCDGPGIDGTVAAWSAKGTVEHLPHLVVCDFESCLSGWFAVVPGGKVLEDREIAGRGTASVVESLILRIAVVAG